MRVNAVVVREKRRGGVYQVAKEQSCLCLAGRCGANVRFEAGDRSDQRCTWLAAIGRDNACDPPLESITDQEVISRRQAARHVRRHREAAERSTFGLGVNWRAARQGQYGVDALAKLMRGWLRRQSNATERGTAVTSERLKIQNGNPTIPKGTEHGRLADPGIAAKDNEVTAKVVPQLQNSPEASTSKSQTTRYERTAKDYSRETGPGIQTFVLL